jgi:hypothetical protein
MLILYPAFVNLPNINTPLASRIADNSKFFPYFKDCLGALDGTHIAVHIPLQDHARYRNRKGFLSQNVLAVCDFDLNFVYVLPGWEGSAHDGRVLSDAQSYQGFLTPLGKYWLGDAGYGNSEYVLTPYRGTRYHLNEQWLVSLRYIIHLIPPYIIYFSTLLINNTRPENPKELFNLRHASLRNVVERIFGTAKRKFKILGSVGEFSIDTQVQLVLGLTGLFNFIRQKEGVELITDDIEVNIAGDSTPQSDGKGSIGGKEKMETFRDQLAEEMWRSYCDYTNRDYT